MNTGVRIHKSAEVSAEAVIGDNTVIWNQAQIREGARIGRGCVIGKDVYIDRGVTVGDCCKIQNGVSIYHGVEIEENVFLGPHMTFTNDLVPRAGNHHWTIVPTRVRRGASIGANATIVCGVTIGEFAMVGAGTVVVKDVEPYALVVGNPGRRIGWVCRCGERLTDALVCTVCNTSYEWHGKIREVRSQT
ncbi:acyltransferase [Brevibacillus borstelensis]|uniref:acyltransferase n=1 Tax=Brevibacillus borstelensis TaxID=45462 RepID=UPI0030C2F374